MEEKELKTKNKEENQKENIIRIFISREAEAMLSAITEDVNRDFEAGRVTRSEVANYILFKFKRDLTENDLQLIRAEHFSVVIQMEAILKKIKNGENVPQNVMDAITESYLGLVAPAKKSKKPLNDKSTNGRLMESEQV